METLLTFALFLEKNIMAVSNVNDSEFNKALKTHDDVIVKYYADWCSACRLYAPIFKRLSEDKRFKKVKFLEVNIDHCPRAKGKVKIDFIPFVATFKNGELLDAMPTTQQTKTVIMLEELVRYDALIEHNYR